MAKCYYKGGGWWLIAGYHYDVEDVQRVLDKLTWHCPIGGNNDQVSEKEQSKKKEAM